MTENEIKQGLEKCALLGFNLNKEALELINRKNEEIERLNLENLQMVASIKNLKAEAIKEFAERVDYFALHEDPEINFNCKDYESYMGGFNQFRLQIVKGIDNLVKEMVGD